MNKEEVDRFLDSKLNLQIGTIDEEGDPNIQPVWFYYDKDREKLLIITPKVTKKVQNLRNRPNVYFSIDDGNFPYKGVKGKGIAAIVEDPRINVLQGEKIYMKYLETLEHPIAKMTLDSAQKGNHVVIEIDPKFFFTWDFAKMQDFESNFVIIKKYRIHCHHTSLLLLDLSNHGLLVHLVMVAVQSLLPQKFKQINNSYLLVKMNNRNPYTCRELVPSQAFYNSVFRSFLSCILNNSKNFCPICKRKLIEHSELQDKICEMITIKQFTITVQVLMFSSDLSLRISIEYLMNRPIKMINSACSL